MLSATTASHFVKFIMSNCCPLTSPGFLTGKVWSVFSLKVYMRSISYLRHSRFVSNSLPSEAVYLPMLSVF